MSRHSGPRVSAEWFWYLGTPSGLLRAGWGLDIRCSECGYLPRGTDPLRHLLDEHEAPADPPDDELEEIPQS